MSRITLILLALLPLLAPLTPTPDSAIAEADAAVHPEGNGEPIIEPGSSIIDPDPFGICTTSCR